MDAKIQRYLKKRYGRNTKLLGIDRLGKGIHGTAYRLRFENSHKEQHLIMKTLFPSEFGHDHFSDRAQVLLLAHANYNEIPRHVKAIDVAGETPDRFISMKEASEFYLFMEEARGSSYFQDLNLILDRGALTEIDRKRAQALAHFLAEIHAVKYAGENAKTLYRRRIRELIGHGECIMGIIDAYDRAGFTTDEEMIDYAGKCLSWWGKIRNNSRRLCRVRGSLRRPPALPGSSLQTFKADLRRRDSIYHILWPPTQNSDAAYFFLADFAPHDAGQLADRLKERNIFIKPLNDLSLGAGFMRVTTALPEDNARFIEALKELL